MIDCDEIFKEEERRENLRQKEETEPKLEHYKPLCKCKTEDECKMYCLDDILRGSEHEEKYPDSDSDLDSEVESDTSSHLGTVSDFLGEDEPVIGQSLITVDFNMDRETRNSEAHKKLDEEIRKDQDDFHSQMEKFQHIWKDFNLDTFQIGDKMGFDEEMGKFVIYPNSWYQGFNRWCRGENRVKSKTIFDKWEREFTLFERELEMYVDYLPNTRSQLEPILSWKDQLKGILNHVQSIYDKTYG